MITLKVEDYCQNCESFDPEVRKQRYLGLFDTEVTCANAEFCERLMKNLTRFSKEDKDDDGEGVRDRCTNRDAYGQRDRDVR